jgi:hypothetical protein
MPPARNIPLSIPAEKSEWENKKIFDFFEYIIYIIVSLALLAGQGPILSIFITPLLLSYSQHFPCVKNSDHKVVGRLV